MADARAFAHHVGVASDAPGDALMVGFAKSRVRAVETRLDAVSSDITKEVNDSLAGILALLKAVASASQTCTFLPDRRAVRLGVSLLEVTRPAARRS